MEMFFEEYDWEAFSYAQVVSVSEMDSPANSLKSTSADDKKTWLFCFDAIFVPYIKKYCGCKQLLDEVITEYKNNSLSMLIGIDIKCIRGS